MGGLQDNGGSLLLPEDRQGSGKMGSPFGGDGGEVIVDPDNGCNILTEYVNLDLWITTNCGRSDGTTHAIKDVAPPDPFPRFIAPFRADLLDKNHWVAGGQIVWTYANGFALQSGTEWSPAFNQGAGHSTTTLSSVNDVVYAPWCGPCNNDGFTRGISTNVGGTWHQLTLPAAFPNRYIGGVAIDPADATGKTVYVAFNGFSRRWTEGPGAGVGHLFRSTDGGVNWSDVSGNLPDVPANDIILRGGKIILATDLGVVISSNGGSTWSSWAVALRCGVRADPMAHCGCSTRAGYRSMPSTRRSARPTPSMVCNWTSLKGGSRRGCGEPCRPRTSRFHCLFEWDVGCDPRGVPQGTPRVFAENAAGYGAGADQIPRPCVAA